MIMTNKKLIYIFLVIFNFYSSLVFGINLRLLDSNADFFNDRIWSKVDSSIILIQERLGFLDESDIVGYQRSEADFNIDSVWSSDLYYKTFAENCREIYKSHVDIGDESRHVAVSMLFKKVSEKYLEHYLLINFASLRVTRVRVPTSDEQLTLHRFIQKAYDRDLVTRFVKAYPYPKQLAEEIERTPSVIAKLKKPETYGNLTPSAKLLWSWVQQQHEEAEDFLCLSKEDAARLAESLRVLDLSNRNIFYDELAERLSTSAISVMSASEAVRYLRRMRDTFCEVNLSDNELADDGFRTILEELSTHKFITKILLQNVRLTDKTFECTEEKIRLFKSIGTSPQTVTIDISGNDEVSISTIEKFRKETGINFIWE